MTTIVSIGQIVIVCLCEGISETEIKRLIKNGAESLEDIEKECGAGGKCGGCLWQLVEILETEKPLDKNGSRDMAKKPTCKTWTCIIEKESNYGKISY